MDKVETWPCEFHLQWQLWEDVLSRKISVVISRNKLIPSDINTVSNMLTPSYHSCSLFPLCQSFRGKLSLFFSKTEAVVSNRTKANPYVTLTEQLVEQLTTKWEELAGPPPVCRLWFNGWWFQRKSDFQASVMQIGLKKRNKEVACYKVFKTYLIPVLMTLCVFKEENLNIFHEYALSM